MTLKERASLALRLLFSWAAVYLGTGFAMATVKDLARNPPASRADALLGAGKILVGVMLPIVAIVVGLVRGEKSLKRRTPPGG